MATTQAHEIPQRTETAADMSLEDIQETYLRSQTGCRLTLIALLFSEFLQNFVCSTISTASATTEIAAGTSLSYALVLPNVPLCFALAQQRSYRFRALEGR